MGFRLKVIEVKSANIEQALEHRFIIANETVSEPRGLNREPRSLVQQKP
jgi:hypothetical protein